MGSHWSRSLLGGVTVLAMLVVACTSSGPVQPTAAPAAPAAKAAVQPTAPAAPPPSTAKPAAPGAAQPTAASPAKAAATGGTINVRLAGDWETLDPYLTRSNYSWHMGYALYDRLVGLDKDMKVVPQLATSWDVKPDTATFKLRNDVTCSDGTRLTPSAVAASLQRLGAPETKAPYAARSLGPAGLQSVTADDAAQTVKVTLKAPHSDLLTGLAMPWASIICPAGLKDPSALQSQAFGTGPYTLTQSQRGTSYTLTARQGYKWGPSGSSTSEPGFPEKVVFRVVDNESTAANLLLSGDLDVSLLSGRDVERVTAAKLTRIDSGNIGAHFLWFNQTAGLATADPLVRKALAMAVDNVSYNKAAAPGDTGSPATSLTVSTMACYSDAVGKSAIGYDPNGAKALLKQAGYVEGADGKMSKGGKPLTVRVVGYNLQNAGPEYVQQAFAQIGVTATVQAPDLTGMVDIVFTKGEFDVNVFVMGSVLPSPSIYLTYLMKDGAMNSAKVASDGYTKNAQAALAASADERCKYWQDAERSLLEAADVKPLNAPKNIFFTRGVKMQTIGLLTDAGTFRKTQ